MLFTTVNMYFWKILVRHLILVWIQSFRRQSRRLLVFGRLISVVRMLHIMKISRSIWPQNLETRLTRQISQRE
jgi:hypothetical protein